MRLQELLRGRGGALRYAPKGLRMGWGGGTEEEPATQGDAVEVGNRLEGFRGLLMGLKLIYLQEGGGGEELIKPVTQA